MSKVIPNHVVRVGQTVCVSSQEEHTCLHHPKGCLSCQSLPVQCLYYSVEGWEKQTSLTQTNACSLPKKNIYDSCRCTPEDMPMASPNLGGNCVQEKPVEPSNNDCPISPTLDISIEKLNRLILEIDPTFQPLQMNPAQTQSPIQVPQVAGQKPEPDSPEIKYIEMSPTRAKAAESCQNSTSSSSTSLSTSSLNNRNLFTCGRIQGDTVDGNSHIAFLGGRDSGGGPQRLPPTGRQSPACIQMSESICIPQGNPNHCIAYGSSSHLTSSPVTENLLKFSQHGRMMQRCSETSVLSASPGSDTSYIFGSSTQSLSSNEPEIPQIRSTGSPSSVGSLCGSPVSSIGSSCYYSGTSSPQKGNSSLPQLYQKGQVHGCSPSPTANSSPTIPIVLINGRPDDSEISPRSCRIHGGSFKLKMTQPSSGTFSSINRSNKSSSESSLSSSSSLDSYSKEAQTAMKFVMDTSKYWFKPSITREQAVQLLMDESPGSFIMRDSTSYRGSFGLAMKVCGSKPGEKSCDLIRHFLIESSARGVHLKGADEEPYFGSLSAFVYQHTIMPLALPCKLVIPSQDFIGGEEKSVAHTEATLPVSEKAAVCNLLYLHSVNMETLTGKAAVQKAVSSTFKQETLPTPTIVHFKVTEQGITLTDIQRKVFFRRHYPLATISFCNMDPENRKWQKFSKTSRIFGVVAKSPSDAENICHLFAEYDAVHPASHVVDFVNKRLPAALGSA
uniref:Tensin 4 n=1 Tax=Anolis carolinensis TaxID=28377 RepID=G1KS71_ANOCA|nr:PREDICTED: tensin-4 [Anolis carolinensis]|eukprot:XP_008111582.1 PREDICTED: tensin-4 [Anolis carolinensis]